MLSDPCHPFQPLTLFQCRASLADAYRRVQSQLHQGHDLVVCRFGHIVRRDCVQAFGEPRHEILRHAARQTTEHEALPRSRRMDSMSRGPPVDDPNTITGDSPVCVGVSGSVGESDHLMISAAGRDLVSTSAPITARIVSTNSSMMSERFRVTSRPPGFVMKSIAPLSSALSVVSALSAVCA